MNRKELFEAMKKGVRKAGIQLAYTTLLMYNSFSRKETPHWAKTIITGAFAYLICPVDTIPDIAPIVGYTDDIGVLSFGLVSIASYINKDVKEKARTQLNNFFNNYDERDLELVDQKL